MNYEIDKDKIKNDLTIDQINELIYELSGEYGRPLGSSTLLCKTICHGGNSFKLYYYDNTKLFRCYTQCGDVFDIFQLVMKVKEVELVDALWYVINFFGLSDYRREFDSGILEDWHILESYDDLYRERTSNLTLKEYDDIILNILPFIPFRDWINENIDVDVQTKYGIRYYPTQQTIIMPHYHIDGKLVGIRQRTIVEEDMCWGKYRPAIINGEMYNHPIALSLYGLYYNQENIRRAKRCIVFEGEKSVMKMESLFGPEMNISVACSGSSLHDYQVQLLLDLGVEEIVIAFDRQFKEVGDEEFIKLKESLINIDKKYRSRVKISFAFDKDNLLPYKASPIDVNKEIFMKLINNRITL